MISAAISLSVLAACLGVLLGVAARVFHVQTDDRAAEILAMMPGSQCGQCGYPGCAGAAAALAAGEAPASICPAGGQALAEALAAKLGLLLVAGSVRNPVPVVAGVREDICIGCTKCFRVCPTDAVVGAVKQLHGVMPDACTGCGKCEENCPTGAIVLAPLPATPSSWVWPKPTWA
ncbi:RnfABCDGE type electron transport complex subunit B [Niveibacterium terrae]|uniref:RnfABCDGE type electron transport complex subunit B n=1 Tax=Niveibacterium terrae TaxID=3373598 RepID=UPI003A93B7BA